MAEKTRGMGRGLAAILQPASVDSSTSTGAELKHILVDDIAPNPDQPRQKFNPDTLAELAESIRISGVLQPVLVRPINDRKYQLIAGERRWRAAQIAKLERVPAVVRSEDDARVLELALVENMARQDLNPVEEAQACAVLVTELGLTREQVGSRVGRSRVAVTNLMRLLELPDPVLELLSDDILSEGHGRALLLASDHQERLKLGRLAAVEGWTVRKTEEKARASNTEVANGRPKDEPTKTSPHPDQLAIAEEIADLLGDSFDITFRVAPQKKGYAATFVLDSIEDAAEFAARVVTDRQK